MHSYKSHFIILLADASAVTSLMFEYDTRVSLCGLLIFTRMIYYVYNSIDFLTVFLREIA